MRHYRRYAWPTVAVVFFLAFLGLCWWVLANRGGVQDSAKLDRLIEDVRSRQKAPEPPPFTGDVQPTDRAEERAEPEREPAEDAADTRTVYITRTGECYHAAHCRYLARSKIPIALSDAQARGYRPCSKCGGGP